MLTETDTIFMCNPTFGHGRRFRKLAGVSNQFSMENSNATMWGAENPAPIIGRGARYWAGESCRQCMCFLKYDVKTGECGFFVKWPAVCFMYYA